MHALRLIIGCVAGALFGVAVVFVGEQISHQLWPPPGDLQAADPDAIRIYLETAPVSALLSLILVWAIAAAVGAFVAARIARRAWAGWIVSGVLLAATLSNFILIPHPWWMLAAAIVLVPLAGWQAARLGAAAKR